MGFDSITIEPDSREGCIVVAHLAYEKGSVLEGQYRRVHLGWFKSNEDALAEHPNAQVMEHGTYRPVSVSNLPFRGFNEANAGERWNDDY